MSEVQAGEEVKPCPQGPHQQVTGCVLCKLEDASEALRHSGMALRYESTAFNTFINAADKLRAAFDALSAHHASEVPGDLAEALSEFFEAIPCPECHCAPCGCPNV